MPRKENTKTREQTIAAMLVSKEREKALLSLPTVLNRQKRPA
jgi:hypothetical protein